jgi:ketosteroid isomerase-like protein
MSEEESTTPDLVAITRQSVDALNRGDFDAQMTFYAPNAVLDATRLGARFEGLTAIRGFFEEWAGAYEEYSTQFEELAHLGNGVLLFMASHSGRLRGSSGQVRSQEPVVVAYEEDRLAWVGVYTDIDEARAAAERLAEERADV